MGVFDWSYIMDKQDVIDSKMEDIKEYCLNSYLNLKKVANSDIEEEEKADIAKRAMLEYLDYIYYTIADLSYQEIALLIFTIIFTYAEYIRRKVDKEKNIKEV